MKLTELKNYWLLLAFVGGIVAGSVLFSTNGTLVTQRPKTPSPGTLALGGGLLLQPNKLPSSGGASLGLTNTLGQSGSSEVVEDTLVPGDAEELPVPGVVEDPPVPGGAESLPIPETVENTPIPET